MDYYYNTGLFGVQKQEETIQTEVTKTDTEFNVKMTVPGIKREEIEIYYLDSKLNVKISSKIMKAEKEISIGETVDIEKITSKLDLGILNITFPILDKYSKRMNIEIQ